MITYKHFVKQVSEEINKPPEVVDLVYRSVWKYIRDRIEATSFNIDLTEEELLNMKPNYHLPSLGKFHCTYNKIERLKRKHNYLKEKYGNKYIKENKTNAD